MSFSTGRKIYGIHSVTPYNRTTGEFYGMLKVLNGSSLSLSGELVELRGGSNKYPWAVEEGAITSEMSLKASEYPDFIFTLFLGKAPTINSAEATGYVSAEENKQGTSVIQATTGLTIAAKSGSESDLKFGHYVVKAVSATSVDVFISSDIDLSRGTNGTLASNLLKITASPITIATTTAVTIANYGLELTGGSGTIALVTNDTATFEVRPINTGSRSVVIGSVSDSSFPEFGAFVMAQKSGSQSLVELDVFRCKSIGVPIGFDAGKFSEFEAKIKVFYDETKDGIFKETDVDPA